MSDQKKLDTEQQKAYEADHNVVVSAGAGSGKTTVLSRRYVRLVQDKKLPVDAILTLTFTRKAAAEMFSRIHQELAKLKDPWVQQQLERFDTARIDTLDSFCSSIVRGTCQNYGIPPNFTIDEGRLKNLAEQTAMEFLMEHQAEPALRELVAAFSFDLIVKDFLADFCQYQLPLVDVPSYQGFATLQVDELLRRINQVLPRLSSLFAEGAQLDTKTGKKSLIAIVDAFRKYQDISDTYSDANHANLVNMCNEITGISKPGNVTAGSNLEQAKILFSEAKDLCINLSSLLTFYAKRDKIQQVGVLLDELAQRFNQKKRTEALLSFSDLIDIAVDSLKTSLPLRTYYKQQIKAIMIDEFQDNNEKQKDLLYLLAEAEHEASPGIPLPDKLAPDKLFFVGDEKQSIYRFRGADVSVFKRLSAELKNTPQSSDQSKLEISTNYRSEPALIDFFNQLFPGVFGNPTEDYEAAYTEAKPNPARNRSGTTPVELFINNTESDEDTQNEENGENNDETQAEQKEHCTTSETEAITLAKRIIQGVQTGEFQYQDVALLFRTTTHQSVYERVFRTVGIPFVSADPRGLFLDAPANDIYAFLQLVVSPQDTNAYAVVLRSPFVNLSDQSFVKLMLHIKGKDWYQPFEALPEDFWSQADKKDSFRYELGTELYKRISNMADTRGIADLVAWLWYESGYRTSLLSDSDMAPTLGHFELLYDLAIQADQRHLTLAAFLDELAPLIGNPEKVEGDETDKRTDAITFITIHKSKGLEFPVVIIPQAGSEGQSFKNDKPYFYSTTYGPVISWKPYSKNQKDKIANPLFEELRETENRQSLAELKRLFYVALTRAERKIIIAGSRKVSQDNIDETKSQYSPELSNLTATLFTKPKPDKKKISFLELLALGIDNVSEKLYKLYPMPPIAITERGRELAQLRSALSHMRQGQTAPAITVGNDTGFYKQETITLKLVPSRITSPTNMERFYQAMYPLEIPAEDSLVLPELKVDPIMAASGNDLETLFGTLCHSLIQNILEKRGEEVPQELLAQFTKANISKEHQDLFIDEAKALAHQFLQTDYGQQALKEAQTVRPQLRTEYGFLLPIRQGNTILIKGSMDLIFETEDHCIIIDFKTDKVLQREEHRIQLECYHRAGKAFSDKPVKTLLVYLRGMNIVEITPVLNDTKLYNIAQGAADAL
uniref:DNA 3'-5' helicase n=1 Tax=Gracilinema caldarium TaxID=215591 RepID=A0A7C3E970_9SPIR